MSAPDEAGTDEAGTLVEGTVVVIGGGTMGQGIATATLTAGRATTVVDVDAGALERARATIARRMQRISGTAAAMPRGLTLTSDLESAVAVADVVIEAVPEIAELKLDIYRRLASAVRSNTLILSNTSTMSVSQLAQACGGSERVIGMHFFNPAHRMALVEIVVADSSSSTTLNDAVEFAAALGKDPVVVRDVPGFITSRLGLLLGTEAMHMVEDGVASAADIDKAMRLGYGHPMGPLELADLVGLDARLNNLRSMRERSDLPQYAAPKILEKLVAEGRLGKKTGHGFYDYSADGAIIPGESRR
ncbi:3-hydroxyacyl-CoA dehydrogenase family protein [Rathayibacter soli]|uniref:3-hydroxyacyl-CoA dehydrogenase family protein n=1 Tax=Rathayibacter soli TaxID=3144168 RepID=UPI0027E4992A|nr:3-hydroxyacyl-CoA dehydrogenase family protein [Glaciibacter superstes]